MDHPLEICNEKAARNLEDTEIHDMIYAPSLPLQQVSDKSVSARISGAEEIGFYMEICVFTSWLLWSLRREGPAADCMGVEGKVLKTRWLRAAKGLSSGFLPFFAASVSRAFHLHLESKI